MTFQFMYQNYHILTLRWTEDQVFLPPSFSDTKNLGFSVAVPYFFAVDLDKNFTLTSRLFANENPFFMGEYNQALKNANLLTDFGYSEGYRKASGKINSGKRHHFFSNFIMNFKGKNDSENSLKYLFKMFRIINT